MKVTNSVAMFWNHYSMRFGIGNGWDFEEDYKTFVGRNEKLYKEAVSLHLTTSNLDVSEWDIAQMGFGDVTTGGEAIMAAYLSHVNDTCSCEDHGVLEDNAVVYSSMHSGSSDYLYARDVREFFS